MPATRKLAAILFADIEGYTAFMEQDEHNARTLGEKFQNVTERETIKHGGRIIQFSGDGVLSIYDSAVEAVHAAVEIQKQMLIDPRVPLRIGIHLGDVVMDEKNTYGDGVNVASRIESFAVAGGVFISEKVFSELRNQKDLEAVSLGKYALKNVEATVEIFAISNQGLVVPSKQKLVGKGKVIPKRKAFTFRKLAWLSAAILIIAAAFIMYAEFFTHPKVAGDGKSIAVLPFENIGNDPNNEYFSDGITEDLITRLSQVPGLRVISRTSVMRYKNSDRNVKQIASELGVSAILEGSVQRDGNRIRIVAQLIDALNDEHLWAQHFDRELKDIFDVQSDVSERIAVSLQTRMTNVEKSKIEKKPTENMEAYLLYQKGIYLWNMRTFEALNNSILLFQQAITLDSNFALAYAAIANSYNALGNYPTKTKSDTINKYIKLNAYKALKIDSDLAAAHTALGNYQRSVSREQAIREYDKAIGLDPNYVYSWIMKANTFMMNGETEKALMNIDRALILDPLSPITLSNKTSMLCAAGRYEEALSLVEQIQILAPEFSIPLFKESRMSIYLNMRRYSEAMELAYPDYPVIESYIYGAMGNKTRAIELHDSLLGEGKYNSHVYEVAFQYYLNGKEAAFKILLNGFKDQKPELDLTSGDILSDCFLGPLRSDPRFERAKQLMDWKPLEE